MAGRDSLQITTERKNNLLWGVVRVMHNGVLENVGSVLLTPAQWEVVKGALLGVRRMDDTLRDCKIVLSLYNRDHVDGEECSFCRGPLEECDKECPRRAATRLRGEIVQYLASTPTIRVEEL